MAITFDEFVNQLDNQSNTEVQIDWQVQKNQWLGYLDALYRDIRGYLEPYKDKIILNEQDITINEEYIGEYPAKKLFIQLGKDTITLTPKGTNLIGVSGRVDMNSRYGTIKLVLVGKDKKNPYILGNMPETISPLVWKIAQQQPRLTFFELNQESFQDALMELVNA